MESKQYNEWKSLKEIYNTPANLRLKHIAIVIGLVIPLLIMSGIFLPDIPVKLYLFLGGCAGLSAVAFVIIVAILVYRANAEFINQKQK